MKSFRSHPALGHFRARLVQWSAMLLFLAAPAWANGVASADPSTPSVHASKSQPLRPGPKAPLRFILASQSRLELRGTTTIGGWSCRSKEVRGGLYLFTDVQALDRFLDRIQAAGPNRRTALPLPKANTARGTLFIPVASLRGNSSGMDRDMLHALKARQHPFIRYRYVRMISAALGWNAHRSRWHLVLRVMGTLTLAGVTRTLHTVMVVRRDGPNTFIVHASTVVRMRNFSIVPPRAFFGLIRGHNLVHVIFDLRLTAKSRAR